MIDGVAVKRLRPAPGKRGRIIESPRCNKNNSPEEANVVEALV